MRLKCPHCGSPMSQRPLLLVTPLFYESFHICRNEECLFRVKTVTELVGYSHASMMPNPAIAIPQLTRGLSKRTPA